MYPVRFQTNNFQQLYLSTEEIQSGLFNKTTNLNIYADYYNKFEPFDVKNGPNGGEVIQIFPDILNSARNSDLSLF